MVCTLGESLNDVPARFTYLIPTRFELFSGSQLHIDMADDWTNIAHYRVTFKPFESVLQDPSSEAVFASWEKPLSIEFLEDQYESWTQDLTSVCWEAREVRELGNGGQHETDEQI